MASLVVAAAIVCVTLPETYNKPTMENLSQYSKGQKEENDEIDGNKKAKDGDEEENALL